MTSSSLQPVRSRTWPSMSYSGARPLNFISQMRACAA